MDGRLSPLAPAAGPAAEPAAGYPLSPQQRRVWALQRDDPGGCYRVACAAEIDGSLGDGALAAALRRVVARHEILRVRFRSLPGLAWPVQVVAAESSFLQLPRLDLGGLPDGERRGRIAALLDGLAAAPHEPDGPPLVLRRLDLGMGRGALLLALPAMCADFPTLDHLLAELGPGGAAEPSAAGPRLQYPDAAELFRQLEAEPGREQPKPPAGGFREAVRQGFAPRALRAELTPGVLSGLEAAARKGLLPLSSLLLAAWHWLLGRHTGEASVTSGVAFDGRTYEGMEGALGAYTRHLPVSARLDRAASFLALAARLARAVEELAALQDGLTPERALGQPAGAPLRFSPFCFRFEEPCHPVIRRAGASERFHLELACQRAGGGLTLELRYDSAVFETAGAGRLLAQLLSLLSAASRAPEGRLGDLGLADAGERHRLLREVNDSAADFGELPRLHELIEEQAGRTPAAVAVDWEGGSLTYGELDARADRLAGHLLALGVGPDVPVALHLERSPTLVTAILAVLKAGGCYLPLDPDYPAARLERMLAASGAPVLLSESRLADRLAAPGARRVDLDLIEPLPAQAPPGRPRCRATAGHLAYLLFTSGSTGAPKGVMVSHRAIVNHMLWMQEAFPLTPADRVLQKTPAGFDASVWEFFAPLLAGARLVLARPSGHRDPAYLAAALAEHEITILQVVPTLLRLLLAEPGFADAPRLRRVFCGGEALPPESQARFTADLAAELVNVYGPTETTIHATSWVARGAAGAGVPIGRPIANARIYVVEEGGGLAPSGAPGELWVGGSGLARGYLADPAQTAARFVPDPWSGQAGERLYRTGDRGRLREDGSCELLGRFDHQLKLRGHRVEPAEIEATLRQATAVREAVVVARGAGDDLHLVAYVVPAVAADALPDLGGFLRERLPEPMVPSRFALLDALPLTPNGKVDRGALPEGGEERTRGSGPYVPPRDPREARIAYLWAEVLGVERVGAEDDFFALGGHSLLAIRLVTRLREELKIDLPLSRLFARPTVAGAAAAGRDGALSAAPAAAVSPDPARAGDPFPLTPVQQAYWIGRRPELELGGVGSHEYFEVDVADLDPGRLGAAWRELVERHGMLRAVTDLDGRQRILPRVEPYRVRVFDLRGLGGAALQRALGGVREDLSHQLFDTGRWPLFAVCASLLPGGGGRLHLSLDLLICDARSLQVLARELVQLCEDPGAVLPPLSLSFRDYTLAAAGLEESEDVRRSREYWQARVATLPPPPQLPLERSPAALSSPRFSRRASTLAAPSWRRLQERARRARLSPPALLLAVFSEVIAQWSRSRRFTLNLPVANRLPLHPEVMEIVGDFTTLCLLEVDFTAGEPFTARARRLQDRLWEDLDHRHVHGIAVLRDMARVQGRAGEGMPVVFTSTLGLEGEDASGALARLGEVAFRLTQTPQVWLDLLVSELEDGLHLDWDAVDALFPPGLLDDMVAAQLRLLEALAEGDEAWEAPVWPLLPAAQRRRREEVNATAAPLPATTLHALVVERAERHPERLAVVAGEERLTYGELLRRSRHLCGRLREAGVRAGALVAVVMEKGWEQAVAVLAVLGARAAYLPLDPDLPAARLDALLAQGEACLVLTQPGLDSRIPWPAGLRRIVVAAGETGEAGPLASGDPDDLAYVMFTSGSTGTPKGVMVRHRGLVNAVLDTNRRFGVGPGDRGLALTALHHDMSVYDLFGLLAAGGTVVFPEPGGRRDPRHWAGLAVREGITVWNSVPALLQMLAEQLEGNGGPAPATLRLALTGGDWIPLDLPDRLRALLPGLAVVSVGGPTETSLWNICHPVAAVDPRWKSIPYGRPIANNRYYVLGGVWEDRPDWVPGELYAAGVGLAAGYFADEEKTRAAFPTHPRTGERLYRTGDLGRYLPGGDIEILGRDDLQVKLQGQRIEPGEIEAALARLPGVRSAVVVAAGERGRQRLVGFIVREPCPGLGAAERIDFKLARHGLRRDLPAGEPVRLPGGLPPLPAYAERRSFRRFLPEGVAVADLGRLLARLLPVEVEGLPVARRRYPSAGGAYPVDVYLHARPGRVAGLAGGIYLYDPRAHGLVPIDQGRDLDRGIHAAVNRETFDSCAFSLFLVGRLDAMAATYGERAREFCWIEAGAMGQLLMEEAPGLGLGLCPVGRLEAAPAPDPLGLDAGEILLHSFLGGGVERQQPVSRFLEEMAVSASAPAGTDEAAGELRTALSRQLPRAMIPAEILAVEALPLTANGKVDRRALAALAETAGRTRREDSGPPQLRSGLEQTIGAVWKEVLGLAEVGRDQAFFELGGNSLHLVQVAVRLGRQLGRPLSIGDLFRHPTIASLAGHLGVPEPGGALAGIGERAGRARRAAAGNRVDHG